MNDYKLTDAEIEAAHDVARKTFRQSQSRIRGQQLTASDDPDWHFARAVESAATAPLLARIAELEAALAEASKDAQRLDWLDEQNADLGNEAWCVLGHDCTADEDFRKFWVGSDLRGAIDKAMKGTP